MLVIQRTFKLSCTPRNQWQVCTQGSTSELDLTIQCHSIGRLKIRGQLSYIRGLQLSDLATVTRHLSTWPPTNMGGARYSSPQLLSLSRTSLNCHAPICRLGPAWLRTQVFPNSNASNVPITYPTNCG